MGKKFKKGEKDTTPKKKKTTLKKQNFLLTSHKNPVNVGCVEEILPQLEAQLDC